ncbi:MAG: DUF2332 family protein [Alphaproteobacteria bacterium]|nr:MAG: DUF2332 family protein [Alphaproteobacteria bacterium]
MAGEADIRAAFAQQAFYCDSLFAPLTGLVCALLGERLDRTTLIGRRVLEWPGNPAPIGDALALRVYGGLHFLVRNGTAPHLAALYPPAPLPHPDRLWDALSRLLDEERLAAWLDGPPQTNEVGRAAVLMSGLLVVAHRFGLPLRLYELGASAGLNLNLDRYRYDLGGRAAGDAASPLLLKPDWSGPPPPDARISIEDRAGVDLDPVPLPAGRERLLAYVWADQTERIARLESALEIAAIAPPRIDQGDAAEWIEAALAPEPEPGVARVVMHSVAYHYFPVDRRGRIARHIEAVGAAASAGAPLAWLRYEENEGEGRFSLRLRTWPGEDMLLAWTHPHGQSVEWLATASEPVRR